MFVVTLVMEETAMPSSVGCQDLASLFVRQNLNFQTFFLFPQIWVKNSPVRYEKFVVGDENYSVRDDNSYVKWRLLSVESNEVYITLSKSGRIAHQG